MFSVTRRILTSTTGKTASGILRANLATSTRQSARFGASSAFLAVTALGVSAALYNHHQSQRLTIQAAEIPHYGVPGTTQERTFIAIKPDGVQRGLVGEVISRFERRGYKLVALKVVVPTEAHAREHYDDLKNKPFFPGLVKYFSSGPVIAMVWEGRDAIVNGRKLVGATNPALSEPGSIRGDLAIELGRNIIHGSDSPAAAKDEITLWFKPDEVASYNLENYKWIYEK